MKEFCTQQRNLPSFEDRGGVHVVLHESVCDDDIAYIQAMRHSSGDAREYDLAAVVSLDEDGAGGGSGYFTPSAENNHNLITP
mmetsp:Transcript_26306/g.77782  ORF Transcript_26306/g.77782 Transcript_26306/m.77782 type:complete len:83 (+) Transcript_26306:523-771(+)